MKVCGISLRKVTGVEVEVCEITPSDAGALLANMCADQRRLNDQRVAQYARDIIEARWLCSNDAIVIGPGDQCMNGQHRLRALVLAGKSAVFIVLRTDEAGLYRIIDGGMPRAVCDVLHNEGLPSTRTLAGVGSLALCYRRKLISVSGSRSTSADPTKVISRQDRIEFCTRHGKALVEIIRNVYVDLNRNGNIVPASVAAAAEWIIAEKAGRETARAFISGLLSGDSMSGVQRQLRTVFVKNAASKSKLRSATLLAYALKAYNFHAQGVTPGVFKLLATEDFPRI